MESCARVIAALPEYSEGESPAEMTLRVEGHLRACPACRRRALRHRATLEALAALPQVVPPPEFRQLVMQKVRLRPLPVYHRRESHLRLVRSVVWIAVAGTGALASGSAALLLAKTSLARTPLTDPSLLTEWLISLGQIAFSLVLSIATRAELPTFLTSSIGLPLWGPVLGLLFLLAASCLLTGFGILATARVVFRPKGR